MIGFVGILAAVVWLFKRRQRKYGKQSAADLPTQTPPPAYTDAYKEMAEADGQPVKPPAEMEGAASRHELHGGYSQVPVELP